MDGEAGEARPRGAVLRSSGIAGAGERSKCSDRRAQRSAEFAVSSSFAVVDKSGSQNIEIGQHEEG
jgi:hypothetical protein